MSSETRAWLWPFLLIATVITLSGTTNIATPDVSLQFSKDKIAHFLVFGLLATSLVRVPTLRRLGARGAVIAACVVTVFGGFDELRQSLTPGRNVELADWIADALGAVVAVTAYHRLIPYRRVLEWEVVKFGKRKTGLDS
jgi:VanZ family protein